MNARHCSHDQSPTPIGSFDPNAGKSESRSILISLKNIAQVCSIDHQRDTRDEDNQEEYPAVVVVISFGRLVIIRQHVISSTYLLN